MHAISSYRGNRPTHTPTHKHTPTQPQTDRTDYNTLPAASAQCKYHWFNCLRNDDGARQRLRVRRTTGRGECCEDADERMGIRDEIEFHDAG